MSICAWVSLNSWVSFNSWLSWFPWVSRRAVTTSLSLDKAYSTGKRLNNYIYTHVHTHTHTHTHTPYIACQDIFGNIKMSDGEIRIPGYSLFCGDRSLCGGGVPVYCAEHLSCTISRDLNLLRRLSWFLPHPLLLLYLKSYILPSFNYCDVVWSGCTLKNSRRLERLMNHTCKLVLRRSHDCSSSAALHDLQLTTLTLRCKLHLAQCMFRCLSFQSPPYLSKLFSYSSSHRKTQSSSTAQQNLPQSRTSLGQKSFSFSGASYGALYHQSQAWRWTFKITISSAMCQQFFT